MATKYETMMILKASLSKDKTKELCDKIQSWVNDNEGKIESFQELGIKDFATEFNKQTKGYYLLFEFEGTNATLDELNRNISVTEDIFRHLTVTQDSVTMENLQAIKDAASRR
jgi:small subunit ribosomal protein S6